MSGACLSVQFIAGCVLAGVITAVAVVYLAVWLFWKWDDGGNRG